MSATRRWLPLVGIGLLVALAGLLVLRPEPDPSAARRVEELSAELRCPDCQGLSVADSPTRSAQEIRRQVAELVGDGATDAEVRDHFVARYGEWVLLAPSSPLPWLVPIVVLVAGVAGLWVWLARRGADAQPPPPTPTEADRARLREEAEALDA
jgi:cytochrome c-type biogenesis protein CcmH